MGKLKELANITLEFEDEEGNLVEKTFKVHRDVATYIQRLTEDYNEMYDEHSIYRDFYVSHWKSGSFQIGSLDVKQN